MNLFNNKINDLSVRRNDLGVSKALIDFSIKIRVEIHMQTRLPLEDRLNPIYLVINDKIRL